LQPRFVRAVQDVPERHKRRLDTLQGLLVSLDPALVLKRGYAWLQNAQGQALSSVEDLAVGQSVVAQLADGEATLTVDQTQPVAPH